KVAFISGANVEPIVKKLIARASSLSEDKLPSRVIFDGQAQPRLIENPQFVALLQRTDWPSVQEMEELARSPVSVGGFGIVDWFGAERPAVAWVGQEFSVRGQAA